MASALRHVSDTAHWVAMYRALESERPDALFTDPWARRLAGPRGEAILRQLPGGRAGTWALVIRTAIFDEVIARLVAEGGVRTVVNLASGLDARPFRMALPEALRWLDVDLPEMQAHKREVLGRERPSCRVEWLPADLADAGARREVVARAAEGPGPALAVTEGLLIYLDDAAVAALGAELRATATVRWWLTDLASPLLLGLLAQGWGRSVAAADAPFRFAPRDAPAFFARLGWREADYRSTWEESVRLGRTFPLGGALGVAWRRAAPLYPAWLREGIRRLSGVALLARGDAAPAVTARAAPSARAR